LKKALFPILVDALRGTFNARTASTARVRARSPHANELCEHLHASKADATKVARMSGGRAKAGYAVERPPRQAVRRSRLTTGKAGLAVAPLRFLSRERKLGKESGLSRRSVVAA